MRSCCCCCCAGCWGCRPRVKGAAGRSSPAQEPWDTSTGNVSEYESQKRQDGLTRDSWKQQPRSYSGCAQAVDLPGWSTHRAASPHACPAHSQALFSGPLTSLIITPTHGWWGLDISNLIDIVLNEADLEKDKKPFPLTAGSNQCVDLGHAGAVKLRGSCSAQPWHRKKLRPSHLFHGWFSSKRERAQGSETGPAPG